MHDAHCYIYEPKKIIYEAIKTKLPKVILELNFRVIEKAERVEICVLEQSVKL